MFRTSSAASVLVAPILVCLGAMSANADEWTSNTWYLRGHLSSAHYFQPEITQHTDLPRDVEWVRPELTPGWTVEGAVGARLSEYLRADVSAEHRWGAKASGKAGADGEFDLSSTVLLANVYLDLTASRTWQPYVGLGIGWVRNEAHDGCIIECSAPLLGGSEDGLAVALHLGMAYELSPGVALDTGYRLSYLNDAQAGDLINFANQVIMARPDIAAVVGNDFRIGIRYELP